MNKTINKNDNNKINFKFFFSLRLKNLNEKKKIVKLIQNINKNYNSISMLKTLVPTHFSSKTVIAKKMFNILHLVQFQKSSEVSKYFF